jgi:ubiquinone/menaquinone biosynthesis C-methylase UbiE
VKAPVVTIAIIVVAGIFIAASLWSPDAVGPSDPDTSAVSEIPEPSLSERLQLFDPKDLTLLEGPDRDLWQKPEQVMDELHIAEGSEVADIGAGAGWFTIRLAGRVGPNGRVYSQDVQPEMITAIKRRVEREDLRNVVMVQGGQDSPNLPDGALDAVLVVDVYPEVPPKNRVMFLRSLAAALRPNGRIGIVNYKPGEGGPGPEPHRRIASSVVEEEARAAGLRVLPSRADLRYQYLIVLGL